MKQSIVADKSVQFALVVVAFYKRLVNEKKEFILSKQLLRSGTAIGAVIKEAEHAESRADFIHKLSISLKEANETGYWLLLLSKMECMDQNEYEKISSQCTELIRLLASIIKSCKNRIP